jgi:glycosyl transferase, family 25
VDIQVILINLDRSTDRLARMRAEFARVGMSFKRFPGVPGTELPASVRPYFCGASGSVASPLRAGEVGCYASHLAVWHGIVAGDYGSEAVLVCEDDLALPDKAPELLEEVLARAPSDWDIIRLSSKMTRRVVPIRSLAESRTLVRFLRSPLETGAYLITRRGASKLLRTIGIRNLPVDRDLARPWLFELNELGVLPPLVVQNVGPSIISTSMGGRDRDRSLLRRSGERLHRAIFNVRMLGVSQIVRARHIVAPAPAKPV